MHKPFVYNGFYIKTSDISALGVLMWAKEPQLSWRFIGVRFIVHHHVIQKSTNNKFVQRKKAQRNSEWRCNSSNLNLLPPDILG
jgi:hypothetical protein